MDTYPPSRAGPPRSGRRGSVPSRVYFLQNASRPATFLRRVPRGFFSTTSSLEESSLDDEDEVDAFAAVDAGAAASSVLAYLEARSSMSLVCLCVVRSSATSAKVEETPANAPLEEAVLDVLLRRDGVAAGDGREACGRKGGGFRAPRGAGASGGSRAALGSVRGPLAPARSQTGGTDAMGSSRFKRPPGAIFGHVPDAAAKLPTTSADRSFMMATAREQANYKRLSWCRA